MMKIGLDITVLYAAQAGVFYYRYNLIKALLRLDPPENDFVLVDYYPIHGGWRDPPEIATLKAPHADTRHIKGLRHRKISRLWFMQKPGLYSLAQGVDKVLLYPWGKAAEEIMDRQLKTHLDGLDIFHTSDVLNHAVPGTKTITTIHDLTANLFPEYHTRETREHQKKKLCFAQEQADGIIAVSESTKRDLTRLMDIDPDRVSVVYEGVDPIFRPLPPDKVEAELEKVGLQPKGYILHLGTIEPRKNLVRLVEAFHRVRQEIRPPIPKLVLAGSTGWFFRDVFDRIETLDLEDEVIFLGRVAEEDLPALYNGALFLVLPSLYEGFGLPALEAMACGLPVIVSNASSLPEVVGQAGLLVDPYDTGALATSIATLMEDGGLRDKLSKAGQERAKLFSWDRVAQETLAVYKNVVGQ